MIKKSIDVSLGGDGARPIAMLVQLASQFKSNIELHQENKVVNAKSKEDARILSRAIVGSNLSKAAIYGCDANFGRFLCAMGYSGAQFDQEDVELFFESTAGRLQVFDKGTPLNFDEELAKKIMEAREVTVFVDMHEGSEEATAWGCDLTYDYVKINADYRS